MTVDAAPTGDTGGQGGAPAATGGTTTPPAAASGTPPANEASSWTTGFDPTDVGYVENKGWKSPKEVLDSYRHFETAMGVPKERLLKLPEKADDPAWAEINTKLGVPLQAKDYQFEVPKEYGDEKFADNAKEWFHKNGVPKAKAEGIVKEWNQYVAAQITAQREATNNQVAQEEVSLKKEWGTAFDQNVKMGRMAALTHGFDEPTINKLQSVMGFAGVMKFMHGLQTKMGEDGFVSGSKNQSNFGRIMSPSQAQDRINTLKLDADFRAKLLKGDAASKDEWDSLNRMASPESD